MPAIILTCLSFQFNIGYAQFTNSTILISSGSSSSSNPQFYTPSISTISTNDNVTWMNKDSAAHNVTFINPILKVSILSPPADVVSLNSNITYGFINTGVYDYYCKFFPFMTGQIHVRWLLSCYFLTVCSWYIQREVCGIHYNSHLHPNEGRNHILPFNDIFINEIKRYMFT